MTSMLLTDNQRSGAGEANSRAVSTLIVRRPRGNARWRSHNRRERAATIARAPGLAFLRAIARRDLLLGRVLAGRLLDHLAHHREVAGHEWRHLLEARAVPHLELDHARAFVIHAA